MATEAKSLVTVSYANLRREAQWGVRATVEVKSGDRVMAITKGGKKRIETIKRVVYRGRGYFLCTIYQKGERIPTSPSVELTPALTPETGYGNPVVSSADVERECGYYDDHAEEMREERASEERAIAKAEGDAANWTPPRREVGSEDLTGGTAGERVIHCLDCGRTVYLPPRLHRRERCSACQITHDVKERAKKIEFPLCKKCNSEIKNLIGPRDANVMCRRCSVEATFDAAFKKGEEAREDAARTIEAAFTAAVESPYLRVDASSVGMRPGEWFHSIRYADRVWTRQDYKYDGAGDLTHVTYIASNGDTLEVVND